ncbi:MAG: GNAT family N-acetyltransferase [Myxococcota bacterium]
MTGTSDDGPTRPDDTLRKPRERKGGGQVEIREMELEDLPEVYALGERLFPAEKWPNLYRRWDEYDLVRYFSEDGELCLVAETPDGIVGFALGTFIYKRRSAWAYGYLEWLGVDPDAQRAGIGGRLIDRLTDLFIEHGARMMLVDTEVENEDAIAFFERKGFGNVVEHLYMSRNLTTHPQYIRRRGRGAGRKGGGR